MEKYNLTVDTKGLRKAAIAIGFGLVVGKALGEFTTSMVTGVIINVCKSTKSNKQSESKPEGNSKTDNIGNDPRQ